MRSRRVIGAEYPKRTAFGFVSALIGGLCRAGAAQARLAAYAGQGGGGWTSLLAPAAGLEGDGWNDALDELEWNRWLGAEQRG